VKPDRKAKFREAQAFEKGGLSCVLGLCRWQILPYEQGFMQVGY